MKKIVVLVVATLLVAWIGRGLFTTESDGLALPSVGPQVAAESAVSPVQGPRGKERQVGEDPSEREVVASLPLASGRKPPAEPGSWRVEIVASLLVPEGLERGILEVVVDGRRILTIPYLGTDSVQGSFSGEGFAQSCQVFFSLDGCQLSDTRDITVDLNHLLVEGGDSSSMSLYVGMIRVGNPITVTFDLERGGQTDDKDPDCALWIVPTGSPIVLAKNPLGTSMRASRGVGRNAPSHVAELSVNGLTEVTLSDAMSGSLAVAIGPRGVGAVLLGKAGSLKRGDVYSIVLEDWVQHEVLVQLGGSPVEGASVVLFGELIVGALWSQLARDANLIPGNCLVSKTNKQGRALLNSISTALAERHAPARSRGVHFIGRRAPGFKSGAARLAPGQILIELPVQEFVSLDTVRLRFESGGRTLTTGLEVSAGGYPLVMDSLGVFSGVGGTRLALPIVVRANCDGYVGLRMRLTRAPAEVEAVEMIPYEEFHVRVETSDGMPLEGVEVRAHAPSVGVRLEERAVTGPDGRTTIDCMPIVDGERGVRLDLRRSPATWTIESPSRKEGTANSLVLIDRLDQKELTVVIAIEESVRNELAVKARSHGSGRLQTITQLSIVRVLESERYERVTCDVLLGNEAALVSGIPRGEYLFWVSTASGEGGVARSKVDDVTPGVECLVGKASRVEGRIQCLRSDVDLSRVRVEAHYAPGGKSAPGNPNEIHRESYLVADCDEFGEFTLELPCPGQFLIEIIRPYNSTPALMVSVPTDRGFIGNLLLDLK